MNSLTISIGNANYNIHVSSSFVVPLVNPISSLSDEVLSLVSPRILAIYITGESSEENQRWLGKWFGHRLLKFPELKRRMIVIPKSLIRYKDASNQIIDNIIIIDKEQRIPNEYQLILVTDIKRVVEGGGSFGYLAIESLSLLEESTDKSYNERLESIYQKASYLDSIGINLKHTDFSGLIPNISIDAPQFFTIYTKLISDCYVSVYNGRRLDDSSSLNLFPIGLHHRGNMQIRGVMCILTVILPGGSLDELASLLEALVSLGNIGLDPDIQIMDLTSQPWAWILLNTEGFKYMDSGRYVGANESWLDQATISEYADYITTTRKKSTNVEQCLKLKAENNKIRPLDLYFSSDVSAESSQKIQQIYIPPKLDSLVPWIFKTSNIINWYINSVRKNAEWKSENNINKALNQYLPIIEPIPNNLNFSKTLINGKILYFVFGWAYLGYLDDRRLDTYEATHSEGTYHYFQLTDDSSGKETDAFLKRLSLSEYKTWDQMFGLVKDFIINDSGQLTFNIYHIDTTLSIELDIVKRYPINLVVDVEDLEEFYQIAGDHYQKILKKNPKYQLSVIDNGYLLSVPVVEGILDKEKLDDLNTPDIFILIGRNDSFLVDEFPCGATLLCLWDLGGGTD